MENKIEFQFIKSKGFLLLIVLFLFILVLTFFFGDSGLIDIMKAKEEIKTLENHIAELEKQKKKLTEEIKALEDNPLALEKKAREKLWLMKENEKVIVIINEKDKSKTTPPGPVPKRKPDK